MPRTKNATKDANTRKTTTRTKTTATDQTKAKTSGSKMTLKNPVMLNEKIRERAYTKFLERGCYHGNDMSDWLVAEQEVKKEYSLSK